VKYIKLQHRTYLGKDNKTKYVQHRINIPDTIIRKLGWNNEDQIVLKIDSKKKILLLEINAEQTAL